MAIEASAHELLSSKQVQLEAKHAAEKAPLPSVSEPDTDRLCLLTHCALGPLHRFRDGSDRRSCLGMSLKLPNIVLGPWISDGGFLLRHVHWSW
jgi:hypothetical protein